MERLHHFEFNEPPDPTKVLGMLSTLPEDVRNDIIRKATVHVPQDPLSQKAIHEHWEDLKANFGPNGKMHQKMRGKHQISTTQSWYVKQDSPLPFSTTRETSFSSALETHSPILVSNLNVGQTHRGRLLIGTIADIDGFWAINSGSFLLEDFSGYVVEVAVYNTPKDSFSKTFALGQEVCIVEPFFKIRGDGSAGVRVDKPEEILTWFRPQTSEGWKELGNSSIKSCPKTALICYEKALQAPNKAILKTVGWTANIGAPNETKESSQRKGRNNNKKQRKRAKAKRENEIQHRINDTMIQEAQSLKLEVSKLLTNISLCEINLGNAEGSLLYALLAFGLGLDRFKASYRIAKALDMCGHKKGGHDFAVWYCSTYEVDSVADKCSTFHKDFGITADNCVKLSGDGSSWVKAETLRSLVEQFSHSEQVSQSCNSEAKPRVAEKCMPWLSSKQQGNQLFQRNDFAGAKDAYISALSSCPFAEELLKETSFILSNKGAAWLGITADVIPQGGARAPILVEGTISMFSALLMHFYDNGRAWIRLLRFLEHQGKHTDSLDFLALATSLLEKRQFMIPFFDYVNHAISSRAFNFVQNELSEIRRRSESRNKVGKLSDISTDEQLRQRIAQNADPFISLADEQNFDDYILQCEKSYTMFQMFDMMVPSSDQADKAKRMIGPTKDRQLVDYCSEFLRSKGVPEGLENELVQKVLYRSFVSDRLHPWMRAMGWRMAWSGDKSRELQDSLMTKEEAIKRWHGTASLKVISQNPEVYTRFGAIVDIRHMKPSSSYDIRLRSNFVNCPNRSDILYEGKTHLAIGFNDLSFLNCSWSDLYSKKESKGHPARVVGIEMNEFSVSKSIVIAEMLGNPNVSLENVLQVWYSTVWSRQTLSDFKDCIKSVLEKGEEFLAPHRYNNHHSSGGHWHKVGHYLAQNVSNPNVASYLHHWLSSEPITFKEARRLWLKNNVKQNLKMFNDISSCKRKQDRLALAQYCLTGEVFGQTSFQPNSLNAVGSLPFWQCPEGSPPLEWDSIFNTFLLTDLMTTYSEDSERNLVQVFEARILSMLETMRARLLSKELTIELYVGVVTALTDENGHDLVRFVSERVKPRTISWSNVIDYFELQQLHTLGRAMSSTGSITHYGYSMNWPCEVFGANIFDYQMVKNYQGALTLLDFSLGENFTGNNKFFINMLEVYGSAAGASELFHCPDWNSPLNSTSFVAAQLTREYWIDYFFDNMSETDGKVGDPLEKTAPFCYTLHNCGSRKSTIDQMTIVPSCPLHRQSTQTYLEWTYDPNLELTHESDYHDSVLDVHEALEMMGLLKIM